MRPLGAGLRAPWRDRGPRTAGPRCCSGSQQAAAQAPGIRPAHPCPFRFVPLLSLGKGVLLLLLIGGLPRKGPSPPAPLFQDDTVPPTSHGPSGHRPARVEPAASSLARRAPAHPPACPRQPRSGATAPRLTPGSWPQVSNTPGRTGRSSGRPAWARGPAARDSSPCVGGQGKRGWGWGRGQQAAPAPGLRPPLGPGA